MSDKKGTIKVETGDILPIIKKWLYSEHDIFLRELVANATDAISKRATLARIKNQEIPVGKIQVNLNKEEKYITITDNGLGMTENEVEKYIAQLAFSGAKEFVQKLEKNDEAQNDIIGKFGLGFYSAFMVSENVIVESLSMEEGSKAVKWICAGDSEYTFEESDLKEIGTKITLHISKDGEEFLDFWKIKSTLSKHCDFMPYQISVFDENKKPETKKDDDGNEVIEQPKSEIVNETEPLWKKDPKEISEDQYKDFYRKLYPMDADPLFWIHLKIDHPFTLDGILYFPKINPNKNFNESHIKLYSKQVFVSDNVKNIIPDFLSLLKGTIDSTDIPLNVSRSSLQGDPDIRKISNYIVKKVGDALKTLFTKDRPKMEKIWEDIGLFVKYGVISDTKFDDLMRDKVLFHNSEHKYTTLPEYTESIPETYKEKMKDMVLYFEKGSSDPSLQKQLLSEGIHSIETDDHIDPHFMQHIESQKKGDLAYKFSSVDSQVGEILESETATPEDMKVKDLFEKILGLTPKKEEKEGEENKDAPMADFMKDTLEVEVKKIKNSSGPAYFKTDEQMKRFSRMSSSMGQNASFPVKKTLVINPKNPLIQNALKIHEKGNNESIVDMICHHVEDLATISSEGLKSENKEQFVERSQNLIEKLTNLAL
jgi:molecular chaperone HtpG